MRLRGKVVVVTGGTGGFGSAIARTFATEGATVVVNHRRGPAERRAIEIVHEIVSSGGRAIWACADVSDWDDVAGMVARVVAELGQIDILVNNAGVLSTQAMADLTLEEWNSMIAVNLMGPVICARHVLPIMVEQSGGNIINIASAGALHGDPMLAYAASKAGLIAITRTVALHYGPHGVRCNAIAPGFHQTTMGEAVLHSGVDTGFLHRIPVGFTPGPENLARVALFLASEDSSYVTGHTLVADGGMTLV